MPRIHLDVDAPPLVILTLVALAAALAWLFYRHTLPPVSQGKRTLLSILRASVLALIVLLLLQPLLRITIPTTDLPVLGILIDNSESMRIPDGNRPRSEALRGLIASGALNEIGIFAELRFFTFGAQLRPFDPGSTPLPPLDEPVTDIASALQSIQREQSLRALVLFTDGIYTLGQNPIHAAERLGLPLFAVGIGDSAQQRDVLISRVSANDRVYADVETPVDVTVRASGVGGEQVEVSLSDGSSVADRKRVTLQKDTREYSVRLSYIPTGEGTRKYTVHLSSIPGELTQENNRRAFSARVLRSKLRVLILAGEPSPDLAVVRQTLLEEGTMTVVSRTQRPGGGFYEGTLSASLLDSADCLVTLGFPTTTTPQALIVQVRDALVQNALPLLFVGGRSLDLKRIGMFGPVVPFIIDLISAKEVLASFEPSETLRGHQLLTLGEPDGFNAWKKLPPLFRTLTVCRARPEAIVLGTARIQGTVFPDPLLLVRNVNRQKSVAIVGYGIWRWRLMAQGSAETAQHLSQFLSAAVQWLAIREESKKVLVTASRALFSRGEAVELQAQVYDVTNRPVDQARVTVRLHKGTETTEVDLRPTGNGRYEGSVDGLTEGEYTFRGTADAGNTRLGEDGGSFSVGGLNLEFQDTRMNAQLLRELAAATGGGFIDAARMDSLIPALRALPTFAPRQSERGTSHGLWDWPVVLGTLLALLSTEWILRKRSGML